MNILRGFTPQAALDSPRFCISAGIPKSVDEDEFRVVNSEVYLEDDFPPATVAKLIGGQLFALVNPSLFTSCSDMGHDMRVASGFGRGIMGRGQIIQRLGDQSGNFVWAGGSDPRGDGYAVPQI